MAQGVLGAGFVSNSTSGPAYNPGNTHSLPLAGTVPRALCSLCSPPNHPVGEIHFADEETEGPRWHLAYSQLVCTGLEVQALTLEPNPWTSNRLAFPKPCAAAHHCAVQADFGSVVLILWYLSKYRSTVPLPEFLLHLAWGGAWESVFCSQAMLMLLVQAQPCSRTLAWDVPRAYVQLGSPWLLILLERLKQT